MINFSLCIPTVAIIYTLIEVKKSLDDRVGIHWRKRNYSVHASRSNTRE
jgi:hypothetical protein